MSEDNADPGAKYLYPIDQDTVVCRSRGVVYGGAGPQRGCIICDSHKHI